MSLSVMDASVQTTLKSNILYENTPFQKFHVRLITAAWGGQFADGFELGIIGLAIALATEPLKLNALQTGMLGAAALIGLFLGSLVSGIIVDRYGRRKIFAWDMLFAAVISIAQYFVDDVTQLLILRLLLGVVLGFDYVVGKALVIEFSPMRYRGRLLSSMAIAWAVGYAFAYIIGYMLRNTGPDAWRYMLIISALPSLLIFGFRVGIPESPLWLIRKGRVEEAKEIVRKKLGNHIILPETVGEIKKTGNEWSELMSKKWRRNTFVSVMFYGCQVIPYFALGTFLPKIFEALHLSDKYIGGVAYNIFLIIGAIVGGIFVDRIRRRTFLMSTFFVGAAVLALLATGMSNATSIVVTFGIFALILSAAANLEFIYPPELFPTHLRGSGLGITVAVSRIGSGIATFLLPTIVKDYGVSSALWICVVILLVGGIVSTLWAPETSKLKLSEI